MRQPPLQRRWIWIAAAIALAASGTLGALFAARADRRDDRQQAHATFLASAAAVASSLTLAAQHEEDLVVAARAYLASEPHASESEFQRWGSLMDAFSRYPELEGGGEVILVTPSRLAAFAAKERSDPAITLPDGRPFRLLPPGLRPFYCLVALSLARAATVTTSGVDYCAQQGLRAAFLATRDSGRITYLPYSTGSTTAVVIEAPIYESGTVPGTLAERRQAFIGAFSVSFLPRRIVAEALRGHPGIVVEIAYDGAFTGVAFRSGQIARGDQTATVELDDGWTMRVFGHPIGAGAIDDPDTLVVLVGGAALSVLLAILVLVLGTGRARALAMVRDKTSELSHQALHDALTGLPNRTLVLDRGERMLARARRDPAMVPAALYVDVDRFKHVNDTFGHAAGDLLLQVVAARLRGVVREEDTVGRLGGDEFVVLLASSTPERPAELVAERLIEVMRQPLELTQGGPSFVPTVSVGIAIGARASSEQLLRDADLALYTAKDSGKDRAVLFEASMQSITRGRRGLELELDTAIEERQLFLLYQPIVDLHSDEIVAVEALVRWRHDERGVVQPADFIPFAEETGQIMAIGRLVLEQACSQAAAWAADGHPIDISVNVSACQLDREAFPQDVRDALESSGLQPSMLTLEITETALMRDMLGASERLRGLRELGVRIALDDIGAGTSALAYLRHFEPDAIKIDHSITAGVAGDDESAAIVRILVEFGRTLGIETLAEGVERPEQLARLKHERCDRGQGFLFARPIGAEEIVKLLAREDAPSAASTTL